MGRHKIVVDWHEVGKYLEAGASGQEIADFLGIHENTLYERCQEDNSINLSTFALKYKSKGKLKIRTKQYNKALSGDTTMLIWLGKQWLHQAEDPMKLNFDKKIYGTLLTGVIDKLKDANECSIVAQTETEPQRIEQPT